jgi:hypothetical protein
MKKYLTILSVVFIAVLALSATSFGRYDPIVNSLGVEPETDEHPWGGEGHYIDGGGVGFDPTNSYTGSQFFIFDMFGLYDRIIVIFVEENVDQVDGKLEGGTNSSNTNTGQTGSGSTGKGN